MRRERQAWTLNKAQREVKQMPYKNGDKVILECRTHLPRAILAMYHSEYPKLD
jgi:hypothetical protein